MRGSTRASTWRRIAATRSSPTIHAVSQAAALLPVRGVSARRWKPPGTRGASRTSSRERSGRWSSISGTASPSPRTTPAPPRRSERTYLAEMEQARRSLAILAENCPENFLCQSLLLSAEIERISGHPLAALDLYERAIGYAESTAMLQHQALANELCARFWLERRQAEVAAVFLAAARRAYARWGATAKVSDLERRYGVPDVRGGTRQPARGRHGGIHHPGRGQQHRPRHRHEGGPRPGRRDGAGAAAGEAAGDRHRERRSRAGRAGAGARRRAPGACPGVGRPGRGAGPRRPAAGGDGRAPGRHRELRPADPGEPGPRRRAER